MALLIALAFGVLVAAGAYADRTGALSPAGAGLSQSAAARAQLARATAAAPATHAKPHRLLAWHAPRLPHVHPVTLPPRVVTISAPAPAAAPVAAQPVAQPVAAQPPHTSEDSGGTDD